MSDDYQRGFFTQEAWEPILADKSRGEKIKIRANCFNYSAVVDADPGQEWQKVLNGRRSSFSPFHVKQPAISHDD